MPIFIKFDGIDGDAQSPLGPGYFNVTSYEFSGQRSTAGRGAGAGKVQFQDFHFSRGASKASPLLLDTLVKNKRVGFVEVLGFDPSGANFLKIKLTDILVTGYAQGGADGSGPPSEDLSLNFLKLTLEIVEPN